MNRPTAFSQRGAVTLVGAIFLIVSVATFLAALQRGGSSGITDSVLRSDGVQALFIAESGLEVAAWRYSSGQTCAVLAGQSGNIGTGRYTVVSSTVTGSLCQVRVVGQVVSPGSTDPATRLIEGLLSGSGTQTGSAGAWTVGKKDRDELLVEFDGTSWSRAASYNDIPDKNLRGVSCVSANDCWAVGDDRQGELIIHWDGSKWSRSGPVSSIPDERLNSIFCLSATDCWAVGDDKNGELIIHWNGSSWNQAGPYNSIPNEVLNSVHCTSGNDCWAVGKDWNGELIIHWDGSSWSRSGPYAAIPDNDLNSVYCVSTDDCWAVGDDRQGEMIIHWDGTSWSRSGPYAQVSDRKLYSVHCVSTANCWAVGERHGYENINHWDGNNWQRVGNVPGISGSKHLYAISMVSSVEGYIVGQDGALAVWDGTTWQGYPAPSDKDLLAIGTYKSSDNNVELVQWSELIQ